MRVNVVKAAEAVRTSYWFIPSVMAFLAIVLGAVMVWLDAGPGAGWLDGLGWYRSWRPKALRLARRQCLIRGLI